jgi:hypothetical protein
MVKIGGSVLFANDESNDLFGYKAVIAKDVSKFADKLCDSNLELVVSSSFSEELEKKLESKFIRTVILDKNSIEDAFKAFGDKDSEVYFIQNEDDTYKLKFFSGSLSKSYQLKK